MSPDGILAVLSTGQCKALILGPGEGHLCSFLLVSLLLLCNAHSYATILSLLSYGACLCLWFVTARKSLSHLISFQVQRMCVASWLTSWSDPWAPMHKHCWTFWQIKNTRLLNTSPGIVNMSARGKGFSLFLRETCGVGRRGSAQAFDPGEWHLRGSKVGALRFTHTSFSLIWIGLARSTLCLFYTTMSAWPWGQTNSWKVSKESLSQMVPGLRLCWSILQRKCHVCRFRLFLNYRKMKELEMTLRGWKGRKHIKLTNLRENKLLKCGREKGACMPTDVTHSLTPV